MVATDARINIEARELLEWPWCCLPPRPLRLSRITKRTEYSPDGRSIEAREGKPLGMERGDAFRFDAAFQALREATFPADIPSGLSQPEPRNPGPRDSGRIHRRLPQRGGIKNIKPTDFLPLASVMSVTRTVKLMAVKSRGDKRASWMSCFRVTVWS